ncbi:MAG TPA: hypothetical protein VFW25_02060 [Silvibacterium sp.]|nr:hypothetical protein [Silvibacterium sp.]
MGTPGVAGVLATVDLTFAHEWTAEILPERPLILPRRQFVYPHYAEEVERGALEVMVRPADGEPFLGTFALGFSDPAAPSGLWSCPDPHWICVVSGGYAYLVNTSSPDEFAQVEYRPVLEVRALAERGLLLFAGHRALLACGVAGLAWQTARISWEGVRITGVEGSWLYGMGWDLRTDSEVPFRVDLDTGEHILGG